MEGSADAQTFSLIMFFVMEGYHLWNIYIAGARYSRLYKIKFQPYSNRYT